MGSVDELAKLFGLSKEQADQMRAVASAAKKKETGMDIGKAIDAAVEAARKTKRKGLVSLGIPTAKELEDAIKKAKK